MKHPATWGGKPRTAGGNFRTRTTTQVEDKAAPPPRQYVPIATAQDGPTTQQKASQNATG